MSFDIGDIDVGGYEKKYKATIVNAGVAYGDYGAQMVFVCEPEGERRTQYIFLSMGRGKFEFGGTSEVITIGEGDKAFEVELFQEILDGPHIRVISKAGLFLNALKHLGVGVAGNKMRVFIGLRLELEEVEYVEAINRFNETHPENPIKISKEYTEKGGKTTLPINFIGKTEGLTRDEKTMLEIIQGVSQINEQVVSKVITSKIVEEDRMELLPNFGEVLDSLLKKKRIEVYTDPESGEKYYLAVKEEE